MSQVLSVRNLRKVYVGRKPHLAVNNISFDLKEGEILGLLGPNGSGKTTTIQMLLGTLSITSGSVSYFGMDFKANRSKILKSVSFASTYNSLPWILSVRQNLEVFGRLYGLNPTESSRSFEPLLERFGMQDKRESPVAFLSAGQVTRLMIIKAFFIKPKIVLLDEPTASLDPDIAKEICSFILEQKEASKLSILFTSHKMQEVSELCDRTIFLKEGLIVADDLPKQLAKSISSSHLKLVIINGLERAIALADNEKLFYMIDQRLIDITIDESQIPSFLNRLSQEGIIYSNIRIEEPSLEDYFLSIARKKK